MDKRLFNELKKRLEKRKAEIADSYRRLRDESRENNAGEGPHDAVDMAVDSYTKDFLYSLSSIELKELHLVEEALAAIEKDEYGQCRQCGKEISEKRLVAVPWARHCLRCQELEEQGLVPSYSFRPPGNFKQPYDEEEEGSET